LVLENGTLNTGKVSLNSGIQSLKLEFGNSDTLDEYSYLFEGCTETNSLY
jgi:hypothetical protein